MYFVLGALFFVLGPLVYRCFCRHAPHANKAQRTKHKALPINLSQNDIQRSNNRHNVRHHFTFRHHRQRGKIHKARPAEMHAARSWSTVRFHINTQLAFRGLDRVINLAGGYVESFSDDQEMMNQRVHVTLHRFAIRQHHFRRVGLHWTRPQARQRLHSYFVRLLHLAHSHHVTRPHVAIRFGRNFEVVGFITRVRVRAPDVEIDAAASQTWTGKSPVDSIFSGDEADALRSTLEDLVAAEQRVKLCDRRKKTIEKLFAPVLESGRKVHHQSADTKIGWRESSTGGGLDQVHYLLAFAEAVEEDGHRANIERVRAEPHEVRGDALNLAHQNANRLCALRNFEAKQLFTRHYVSEVVAERIEIIHPVGDDDPLLVLLVLEQLLHARVEIADVRGCFDHHLAVEHEFQTQHAVC